MGLFSNQKPAKGKIETRANDDKTTSSKPRSSKDPFAEGRTFEVLQKDMYVKSAHRAWLFAFLFGIGFILSVIAIVLMMPLKTEVPYLVRVNDTTGASDLVQVLTVGNVDYGEVVDKKHVADYIKYREGYEYFTVGRTFNAVLLMSSNEVAGEFRQDYKLHETLNRSARVDVDILSISLADRMVIKAMYQGIATVRYRKTTRNTGTQGATVRESSQWVATIKYVYLNASQMGEQDRLINPLAFQVVSWRSDPETVLAAPRLLAPKPEGETLTSDAPPMEFPSIEQAPATLPGTVAPQLPPPSGLPSGTTTYPMETPAALPSQPVTPQAPPAPVAAPQPAPPQATAVPVTLAKEAPQAKAVPQPMPQSAIAVPSTAPAQAIATPIQPAPQTPVKETQP